MSNLQVNFYPVVEVDELVESAKAYQNIWSSEGNKITEVIENVSGLHFKFNVINSLVVFGISKAFPLLMRSDYSSSTKRATLIHELCHRLLEENGIRQRYRNGPSHAETTHKQIFLILYDIWEGLYGNKFAEKEIQTESARDSVYENAWGWALAFNKDSRRKEFQKVVKESKAT